MRIKKVEPLEPDPDNPGEFILCLDCDGANADWIRAARLQREADAGDKEAARKLKELEDTPVYEMSENEG